MNINNIFHRARKAIRDRDAAGQHTVYYVKPARISIDVTSPLTIGSVTCDQCAADLDTLQVFCWRNPERR